LGKNNTSDIPNQGTISKIPGEPSVWVGDQGRHVKGHPNCQPSNTIWADGVDHVWETQNGWQNYSKIYGKNDQIRYSDPSKVVGRGGERYIRIVRSGIGSDATIHGYPINKIPR